jgi:hypothetical protein
MWIPCHYSILLRLLFNAPRIAAVGKSPSPFRLTSSKGQLRQELRKLALAGLSQKIDLISMK